MGNFVYHLICESIFSLCEVVEQIHIFSLLAPIFSHPANQAVSSAWKLAGQITDISESLTDETRIWFIDVLVQCIIDVVNIVRRVTFFLNFLCSLLRPSSENSKQETCIANCLLNKFFFWHEFSCIIDHFPIILCIG